MSNNNYVKKEKPNLAARDEAINGVLRTPIAFLMGGPAGIIANAAYTALKVHYENEQQKKCDGRYRELTYQPYFDPKVIEARKQKEEAEKNAARQAIMDKRKEISTLIRDLFANATDADNDVNGDGRVMSWGITKDIRKMLNYPDEDRLYWIYSSVPSEMFGDSLFNRFSSEYYEPQEFLDYFHDDLENDNIEKMYVWKRNDYKREYFDKENRKITHFYVRKDKKIVCTDLQGWLWFKRFFDTWCYTTI